MAAGGRVSEPERIWTPTAAQVEAATVTRFQRAQGFGDHEALRRWSVAEPEAFWLAIWRFFDVQADGDPARVLAGSEMPGARWFPDVALSYPEHVFRDRDSRAVALRFASEEEPLATWTWGRLREQTARIRAGLRALGVGRGDRVVAYLPNVPETVAAMLAVTSLGAIWSCCSPDFGSRTVLDRFAQVEPKVLLAAERYRYGGREFDRAEAVSELARSLPSLERVVRLGEEWEGAFPPTAEPLAFARVPFDHPLWILYSSGTTGKPKAIVHGHGGILLEHLKVLSLHVDARAGDRVLWFTTTGWMMWNFLVGVLLTEASIVLYDGSPGHPDLGALWALADRAGVTIFGTGAAFLHACMTAGLRPGGGVGLPALRAVGSTGSPLSPEGFGWVRHALGAHVWLFSTSGGTDVCSAFVGGSPVLPVHVGELQTRCLGVAVEAFDEQGRPVVDEVGELVVTAPMPSMPIGFWDDPGDARYRASYFDVYPGVWRHGDWIRITERGSAVILGRSDATINRAGIRIGTAEIYRAVLAVDGVLDALVVDVPSLERAGEAWMPLFVVLAEGVALDARLEAAIRGRIRADCSPRHVPDEFQRVDAIPRTLTGKLLEVPVKRLLMGHDPETVAARDALDDPRAFAWFVEFARARRPDEFASR